MRWDRLFDDLEGQLEQELAAEEIDLGAEEERLRLARLSLRDRLAALARAETAVRVVLRDGVALPVRLSTVGRDWFAGALASGAGSGEVVIPLDAVASLVVEDAALLASAAAEAATDLSARLGLGFALRDLCRRRLAVDVATVAGDLHGTIDRVGRDHLDLAEHERGEPRRASAVARTRLVPLSAVLVVRW